MSEREAAQFVDSFFAGLVGLIVCIVWLAYMISTAGNLKRIRKEAEKQTALLEQIDRNTRPPRPPGEKPATVASLDYIREKKSSGATVLVILGAVFLVLLVIALARK